VEKVRQAVTENVAQWDKMAQFVAGQESAADRLDQQRDRYSYQSNMNLKL
jgi:hypothetical protein